MNVGLLTELVPVGEGATLAVFAATLPQPMTHVPSTGQRVATAVVPLPINAPTPGAVALNAPLIAAVVSASLVLKDSGSTLLL